LRGEVIDILSTLPMREGKLHTINESMILSILAWTVELEEGSLTDEEYVPMDLVFNITELEIDAPNRLVFVEAVQVLRGQAGTTVKSTTLKW
jgi:hypothetical protein